MAGENTQQLATVGAAFGPWGAAIGAVVGVVMDVAMKPKGPVISGDVSLGGVHFNSGVRKLGPLDWIALGLGLAVGIWFFFYRTPSRK